MNKQYYDVTFNALQAHFPEHYSRLIGLADQLGFPINDVTDWVLALYLKDHTIDEATDSVIADLRWSIISTRR
jgi:hypothetical protein